MIRYSSFDELFKALATSSFRSGFRLSLKDRTYAQSKGEAEIKRHAGELLRERIGAARPMRDGRQTPFKGHPVFTAQHATGCCCRSCLLKWHGIPKGEPLTKEQISELSEIVCEWIRRDLQKPAPKRVLKKGEIPDLFEES